MFFHKSLRITGEGGDFGVGPMLDSGLCERTKWPYAGKAEGERTHDVSCASEVSVGLYTDHSECSGSVSKRRSVGTRRSAQPRRSVGTWRSEKAGPHFSVPRHLSPLERSAGPSPVGLCAPREWGRPKQGLRSTLQTKTATERVKPPTKIGGRRFIWSCIRGSRSSVQRVGSLTTATERVWPMTPYEQSWSGLSHECF